jgi:hypothetical protein
MKIRDVRKIMREHGFKFIRIAKHGDLWTDGISTMLVPGQPGEEWRAEKNLMYDLKKALRRRKQFSGA